jgi:hypothetical protein
MNDSAYAVDLSGWMVNDLTAYDGVNTGTGKPRQHLRRGHPTGAGQGPRRLLQGLGHPRRVDERRGLYERRIPNSTRVATPSYLQGPQKQVVDSTSYSTSYESISYNRTPDATREGTFVLHTTLPSGGDSSAGQRADGSPSRSPCSAPASTSSPPPCSGPRRAPP